MKNLLTIGIVLLVAGVSQAAPLKLTAVDPFGPGNGCPDVAGTLTTFDIKDAIMTVDTNTINFVVDTNYGGSVNGDQFGGFTVSGVPITLYIGDVIFTISGVAKYGVALTAHQLASDTGAVTLGEVYRIDDPTVGGTAIATAGQVIGLDPSHYEYYPNYPVWIHLGGGLTDMNTVAAITATSTGGNGSSAPEYQITVDFSTLAWGGNPFLSGSAFGFSFASATCANDYIDGSTTIPEPATMAMVGGALTLLSLLMRKRRT